MRPAPTWQPAPGYSDALIEAASFPQAYSPGIGAPVGVQHLRGGVGAQAERGAQRRRDQRDRVERRRRRSGRGWHSARWSGSPYWWPNRLRALAELRRRRRCRRRGCCRRPCAPDRPGRRRSWRPARGCVAPAVQVAGPQVLAQRAPGQLRADHAEPVAVQRPGVDHQPGRHGRRGAVRVVHGAGEPVVGHRLVDEPPAVRVDRDDARLGAVPDVREHRGRAVAAAADGTGEPERVVVAGFAERAADGLGQREGVAGRALGGAGVLRGRAGQVPAYASPGSAEKPPPASTTPRRARTRSSRPW